MVTKVALVNRRVTNNYGDRIIGKALRNIMFELGYEYTEYEYTGAGTIHVSLLCRAFHKLLIFLFSKQAVEIHNFFCVIKNFRNIRKDRPNFIIIGGGQLLEPNNRFISSLLAWFIISKCFKIELILFSVGYEEFNKKKNYLRERICKYIIPRVKNVYLRDEYTRKYINKITRKNYPIIFDVAYCLNCNLKYIKRENIILSLTGFKEILKYSKITKKEEYLELVAEKLREEYKNSEKVFFISSAKQDYYMFKEVGEFIKNKFEINTIKIVYNTEDELIDFFNSVRVVISSRLHSLIVGEVCKCKVVPLVINEKIDYYANNFFKVDVKEKRESIKRVLKEILQ